MGQVGFSPTYNPCGNTKHPAFFQPMGPRMAKSITRLLLLSILKLPIQLIDSPERLQLGTLQWFNAPQQVLPQSLWLNRPWRWGSTALRWRRVIFVTNLCVQDFAAGHGHFWDCILTKWIRLMAAWALMYSAMWNWMRWMKLTKMILSCDTDVTDVIYDEFMCSCWCDDINGLTQWIDLRGKLEENVSFDLKW